LGLDVVDVDLQVVVADLLCDGATKVADGTEQAGQLVAVEIAEDRAHLVLLDRLDLIPHPRAFRRTPNEDDASVVWNPDSLDEAASIRSIKPLALLRDTSTSSASRPIVRSP